MVTDGRLTGGAWFVVANPAQHSGIEVVTLQGADRPLLEQKTTFVTDSIEYRLDFDAAVLCVDYRGLAKNPGP